MNQQIKIVLVIDQEIFRTGIRNLLEDQKQFKVVGTASRVKELLQILNRNDADIAVLHDELQMAGSREGLNKVCNKYRDIKVIIIGSQTSTEQIRDFIMMGARAYLSTRLKPEDFIKKTVEVYEDKYVLDKKIMSSIINLNTIEGKHINGKAWLTAKEKQIYSELKKGQKVKEVAENLGMDTETVKTHKRNMFSKTGTHSTTSLINFIEKNGWA